MKKFLTLILFSLFGLTSCVQTEDDYMPNNNENVVNQEIVFNTYASYKSTRAIVEGTSLIDDTYFGVFGYVQNSTNTGVGGYIMKDAKYTSNGQPADGAHYYWPKADDNSDINCKFVAYYPYDGTNTVASWESDVLTYHVTAANTTATGSTDVLYAINDGTNNWVHPVLNGIKNALDTNQDVNLQFRHALACIQFQAKMENISNVKAVKIKSITFNNNDGTLAEIYTTGDLVINTKTANASTPISVTNLDNASTSLQWAQYAIKDNLTTSYEALSTGIVIPQAVPDKVTITYDITIKNGDNDEITYSNRVVTRKINTGKDDNNKSYVNQWLASNKYIYRIYITGTDVTFNVQVDNWAVDNNWWQIWDSDNSVISEDLF